MDIDVRYVCDDGECVWLYKYLYYVQLKMIDFLKNTI